MCTACRAGRCYPLFHAADAGDDAISALMGPVVAAGAGDAGDMAGDADVLVDCLSVRVLSLIHI